MRRHRVIKRIIWTVAALAVVGAGLWFMPTNDVVISPGITGDLSQMVRVQGGHTPGPGRLLMVAVSVSPANEFIVLLSHVDPNLELLPRQEALGGLSMHQYIQYNYDLMSQSKWAAEVAGERLAGLPARVVTVPGALVVGITKNGTAYGKIKPGDRIVAVGPYAVTDPSQVRAIMLKHFKVGEIVNFTVVRHHQRVVIPLRTTRIANDPAPAIGVYIVAQERPIIPRPVTIKSAEIGGPSAGMMFALEIYQQITGQDLAKGGIVAGTGEISPDGRISMIGGVAQKVITVHRAGAKIFLVPSGNYAKALWMDRLKGYHMKIYPVNTLKQALEDLRQAPS